MILFGVAVILKAGYMMFFEREYWEKVADRFVKENIPIKPTRGNIISADGKLMASSLPEYRIYLDCNADNDEDPDYNTKKLLLRNIVAISEGLHQIFVDKTAHEFRKYLEKGVWSNNRNCLIYPKRISYIQLQEVKQLPVFNLPANIGGLHEVSYNQRQKLFGSLASRTLGSLYADVGKGAKNGIELSFDNELRGKNGITHRQKVMNRFLNIIDVPPVDGSDVITTIDVDMQDISEKALVDELKKINATSGVAILMEVKTGNVKAIVNMDKCEDGEYLEKRNDAISSMMEPGSTFKTASIMVALEDGYITPNYMVDTGDGIRRMYDRNMKDWNWYKGGFHQIDVTHILMYSSNIGVSTIIDKFYHNNPQKYIDGLKRMGLDKPLKLQIKGEGIPNIKGPKERYFASTTLPWMSIGYETQIPPLNILNFYNAIANNGVMVRPKFVSAISRKGEIVKTFPTQVINSKICSDRTLSQIREILKCVVNDEHGLGKPAKSKNFLISGKTGTAQVSQGSAGYKRGGTSYLVSFCGYFPSDNPKYSCIVSIRIPGGQASGGLMAGSVVHKIAEQVYAKDLRLCVDIARDSTGLLTPHIMDGDWKETKQVLRMLRIGSEESFADRMSRIWCHGRNDGRILAIKQKTMLSGVPSVIGMGAKDAVFLLTSKGLIVGIKGVGKVVSQSLQPGIRCKRGQKINLILK